MQDESQNGKSRREFITEVGASALALSALSGAAATAAQSSDKRSSSNSKVVRIGVVGGGFGAQFQWHLHPYCKVVAVCERRPDRLEVLKTTYKADKGYASYEEFLRHPGLDAVALFTPAPFHVDQAVPALMAGKHVISAVPAGLTIEEVERLLHAVKQSGMKYMMAETSRYRPEVIACVDWAKEGKFGTIFYSEAEYHHTGIAPYSYGHSFDCQTCDFVQNIDQVTANAKGKVDTSKLVQTWAAAYPPMLYPTHCTGLIIPVIGERFTEVVAHGWGDNHEMLKKNYYNDNPFFHTVAMFKTSENHAARISIGWHLAAGGTERGLFYGDRMSYIMERPEGSPDTKVIQKETNSSFGIYVGEIESDAYKPSNYYERLPEPLRVFSHHGNSHPFITHEFISAIVENRHPTVNVWEALAYTVPGIVAHQSALEGGSRLMIKNYGSAPV